MLTRLRGELEHLDGHAATVRLSAEAAIEVLVPGYVSRELATMTGQIITFHTYLYLEGQGQGSSFEPRLIGFLSPTERKFFDLFTTVKGIGNRKALRALSESPHAVAAAIARRDARWLTNLPEIGKRLAETIVAELFGKVDAYRTAPPGSAAASGNLPASAIEATPTSAFSNRHPPAITEAIETLCALGETRADAERKVLLAVERASTRADGTKAIDRAESIVALVYASR